VTNAPSRSRHTCLWSQIRSHDVNTAPFRVEQSTHTRPRLDVKQCRVDVWALRKEGMQSLAA
jgi:hypothetical protein